MSTDPTEPQDNRQRREARQRSLKRGQPPAQVPGYDPERFLGVGAYGEVWVAKQRNTGRRVAIKFYTHRGGLDWSLLSREVEKLAFLFADRYVVQLLGVGWDAEPPYYIMEYLERGSLAERLQQGPLPIDEAVTLFRDVAVGLVHAHVKGVLHCDLKPANILLDQDDKPRLADFGQSRLSSEQTPALGTLFYMAPEQADLEAVPDARWDVYALGALLHCMLTGSPPHRTNQAVEQFDQTPHLMRRLSHYRRLIEDSPLPDTHRKVRGIDRDLIEIIDRCLAADPDRRFPTVQAVLDALDHRAERRARRPMVILGTVGPILLLLVVAWFAWRGFGTTMERSDAALTHRALQSNQFAAQYAARAAANQLDRRFRAAEQVASSEGLRRAFTQAMAEPEFNRLMHELYKSDLTPEQHEELRNRFQEHPSLQAFQNEFDALIPTEDEEVASWFFCDAEGTSWARMPRSKTIGRNFAWRSYFHGGSADRPDHTWRPPPGMNITKTTLSAVFRSQASERWIVAVSTPVFEGEKFLGIVALTVEVGQFGELKEGNDQFAVLVDLREGDNEGVILQHPLFDKLLTEEGSLPDRLTACRLTADDLPNEPERMVHYRDPLGEDPAGAAYRGQWLARMEPVRLGDEETGWVVIVQEAYEDAIGSTLAQLQRDLVRYGMIALLVIMLVMLLLWRVVGSMQ